MIRVYLDTCCLNRPLDDQSQDRVRLETEAIAQVFDRVTRGLWTMIGSDPLNMEIAAIRDPDHRQTVELLVSNAREHVRLHPGLMRRGELLESMGFRGYDSLHIACAEAAGADVLLTTDDALVRRARRLQRELGIRVANPLTWFKEGPE